MKDDTSNALPVDQVTHSRHQFGILDMVLFTTGAAVGLTAISPSSSGARFSAMGVLYSLSSSITLGSLFVLIRQRIKSPTRFSQPGVLLLFAIGIETLLYMFFMRLHTMYFQDDSMMLVQGAVQTVWYVLIYASITFIACGLLIWGMLRVTPGWKLMFLLCVVGRIVNIVSFASLLFEGGNYRWITWGAGISNIAIAVAVVASIACIANDRENRVRSLMHWIGIACFLAFATLPFLQILLSKFLTSKQLYGV